MSESASLNRIVTETVKGAISIVGRYVRPGNGQDGILIHVTCQTGGASSTVSGSTVSKRQPTTGYASFLPPLQVESACDSLTGFAVNEDGLRAGACR